MHVGRDCIALCCFCLVMLAVENVYCATGFSQFSFLFHMLLFYPHKKLFVHNDINISLCSNIYISFDIFFLSFHCVHSINVAFLWSHRLVRCTVRVGSPPAVANTRSPDPASPPARLQDGYRTLIPDGAGGAGPPAGPGRPPL